MPRAVIEGSMVTSGTQSDLRPDDRRTRVRSGRHVSDVPIRWGPSRATRSVPAPGHSARLQRLLFDNEVRGLTAFRAYVGAA